MVKYTSSILLVAAFVAAPVFAQSNWDEFEAREYDDLFTRHPDEAGLVSREIEPQTTIFERSYDFNTELESRSYDADDIEAREFDELYERAVDQMEDYTPNFFTFMRDGIYWCYMVHRKQVRRIALEQAAAKHNATTAASTTPADPTAPVDPATPEDPAASAAEDEPTARELDEDAMWERALDEVLQERDFADEDLFERQYNEEMEERDFDDEDLLEREYDQELQEREFDDEAGLYERDYTMFELLERAYFEDLD